LRNLKQKFNDESKLVMTSTKLILT